MRPALGLGWAGLVSLLHGLPFLLCRRVKWCPQMPNPAACPPSFETPQARHHPAPQLVLRPPANHSEVVSMLCTAHLATAVTALSDTCTLATLP